MTNHAQPRSVSVSHVTATSAGPARHSISATTNNLLNANTSGIFLSNDDSYLSTADISHDMDRSFTGSVKDSLKSSLDHSLEESLDDGAQEPLDIVGALSTLNLDGELGESLPEKPGKNVHGTAAAAENGTNTSLAQDRGHASSVPPPSLVNGKVFTPNMPSTASFGGMPQTLNNPGNTPTYGWGNNFLPFSAPPLAYPVSDPAIAAEMALNIRPFRLPDEFGNGTTLNGAPSAGQNGAKGFGGSLDMRYGFDGFGQSAPEAFGAQNYASYEGAEQNAAPGFKNGGNGGNDVNFAKSESKEHTNQAPYQGSNLWNQPQLAMPPFVSAPISDNYLSAQYSQYALMAPNVGGNGPGQMQHAGFNENANFGGSRAHAEPQSGPRRHNHNGNYGHGHTGGVNVHRKMHNSRRRGDDASKYANAKLEDFKGEILSLCKDQHGCRFLQRQLDASGEAEAEGSVSKEVAASMIFNELYLKIVELMVDPFGNYLIQKLFESVSPEQRLVLVKNAAPEFIRIALDPHGTRALQKLVECITSRDESRLVIDSLAPHIVSLSRDLNGNHVVQKCLQRLQPEENQFIFDTAAKHCGQIATHRHGCCVLQRCLDHGNASQREQLSRRVAEISADLSLDPFGNYVVQYVLTRGDRQSVAAILDCIRANIVALSLHKFGSNVIEKSLRIHDLSDAVIAVLLQNQKQFSVLLNDPYGNYVLQTSLDVASARDLARLAAGLQPFLGSIKNTPHGRRILTKIQNIL